MTTTVEQRLERLRRLWERKGNPRHLSAALFHLKGKYPELDWLFDALRNHLKQTLVPPRQHQQRVQAEHTLDMLLAVREAMGDGEEPTEANFRAAADALNVSGIHCTPAGVKKAWQRHLRDYR